MPSVTMKIADFTDKHQNQIAFICGSGPSLISLSKEDRDIISSHIVFSVNGGILAFPDSNYFVSDDYGVVNWSYFSLAEKSNCTCFFYDKKFYNRRINIDKQRICFYSHKSWFSPPDIYNLPDGLRLTKDEPIIGSRISSGSAIHIAYILGFKTIVLLGHDCQLSPEGYRYFWQYWDKNKHPYRTKGNNFNSRTQNFGFSRQDFLYYWEKFCEINKDILQEELRILDASNGKLDCFEKIDLKDL